MCGGLEVELYGVRVRVVDTARAGVCPLVAELLPPGSEPSVSRVPDVSYVVRHARRVGPEAAAYEVLRDDEVRFRAATPADIARRLCGEIDSAVALNSQAALFVHAGVVGWR